MTPAAYGRAAALLVFVVLGVDGHANGSREPCEGPDASAWVTEYQARVRAEDALFAYATAAFGVPLSCEGDVFEYDGRLYGGVAITLPSGAAFASMTQPPEAVVVWVEAPSGFPDEAAARDMIRRYAEDRGLAIDWSAADVEEDGGRRSEQYWDPDQGLNGSVTLVYEGEVLVEMGVSMSP